MNGKWMTILIVDDDPDMRNFLRAVFEPEGFAVYEARDGLDAVKMSIEIVPDIIVLDVVLPHLNGWDVLEIIRKRPETRLTPVVLMSGSSQAKRKYDFFPPTACAFVQKPFSIQKMVDSVNSLSRQKQADRGAAEELAESRIKTDARD